MFRRLRRRDPRRVEGEIGKRLGMGEHFSQEPETDGIGGGAEEGRGVRRVSMTQKRMIV